MLYYFSDHRRNKRSLNIKNLAGALVGIVIFLVVLGIAIFACIKRKKLTKQGEFKLKTLLFTIYSNSAVLQ